MTGKAPIRSLSQRSDFDPTHVVAHPIPQLGSPSIFYFHWESGLHHGFRAFVSMPRHVVAAQATLHHTIAPVAPIAFIVLAIVEKEEKEREERKERE